MKEFLTSEGVIAYRNEYEDILVCVALEPDPNKKVILDIYRGMPTSIGFDAGTIVQFVHLTNKALDWIDIKLNEEHQTIVAHLKKWTSKNFISIRSTQIILTLLLGSFFLSTHLSERGHAKAHRGG